MRQLSCGHDRCPIRRLRLRLCQGGAPAAQVQRCAAAAFALTATRQGRAACMALSAAAAALPSSAGLGRCKRRRGALKRRRILLRVLVLNLLYLAANHACAARHARTTRHARAATLGRCKRRAAALGRCKRRAAIRRAIRDSTQPAV